MTNKQAVKWLKAYLQDTPFQMEQYEQAFEMAIKALSQEPTDKPMCDRNICISNEYNGIGCDECVVNKPQEPCEKPTTEDAIKTIQELMIACTPDSKYYRVGQMAISAMLENEELSKDLDEALQEIDEYERGLSQEPCDDAISRKDAEQMFRNIRCHLKPQDYKSAEEFNTRDLMLLNAEQMIHALPSVTQKSGKWIELPKALNPNENPCKCSECGHVLSFMNCYPKSKFCPNCGARMESEE